MTERQQQVVRRGPLPAMALGAAIGTVAGNALDRAAGGADPAFAGAIGAALGAALGRSGYIRVAAARTRGIPPGVALAVLAGRIAGCVLLGVAIVGSLAGASAAAVTMRAGARGAAFAVGVALLVATAFLEQRWTRRAQLSRGGTHGA